MPRKKTNKTNKTEKTEKSDELHIFTDGSCLGNGKKNATAGYGVHFPSGLYPDMKGKFMIEPITNQRAELFAIYKSLRFLKLNKLFKLYSNITIYTDSQYSINSLTIWSKNWEKNDWKTSNGSDVLNTDLIKPIRTYLDSYTQVKLVFVRAHTGKDDYYSKANAVVDELANEGRAGDQ